MVTLNFSKNSDGWWEATASAVKGVWQLHIEQASASGIRVLVYSKATGTSEEATLAWDSNTDEKTAYTQAFQSFVSEDIIVKSRFQPTLGNIRTEG